MSTVSVGEIAMVESAFDLPVIPTVIVELIATSLALPGEPMAIVRVGVIATVAAASPLPTISTVSVGVMATVPANRAAPTIPTVNVGEIETSDAVVGAFVANATKGGRGW
jgi:hypothetical protein